MKVIHVTNHWLILLESRREKLGGVCESPDHMAGWEDDHLKAGYGRSRQLETNLSKHGITGIQHRYIQTQENTKSRNRTESGRLQQYSETTQKGVG